MSPDQTGPAMTAAATAMAALTSQMTPPQIRAAATSLREPHDPALDEWADRFDEIAERHEVAR